MEQTNPLAKSLIIAYRGRTLWTTAYVAWALMIANVVFPFWGVLQGTLDASILIALYWVSLTPMLLWEQLPHVTFSNSWRIISGILAVIFLTGLSTTIVVLSRTPAFLEFLSFLPCMFLLALLFITLAVSGSPFRFRRVKEVLKS